MNRVRFLSKIILAASVVFALALTFLSCSSDSPTSPSGGESSSSQKSSSSFIPPTMDEACNSFWVEAIDQIANQCSINPINMAPTNINIPIAPSSDQTYGYNCSLTSADVNAIMKEVCCDRQCFLALSSITHFSAAICRNIYAQCGIVCKNFLPECKNW